MFETIIVLFALFVIGFILYVLNDKKDNLHR